jgi:hypothetical protein
MSDFAINVFKLFNQRGYIVPTINVIYLESGTGLEWRMTCGGTRAYLVRFGNSLQSCLAEQAADSHFMIRRITSSLLIGGVGLFQAEAMGRLLFKGVEGAVTWDSHLDFPDPLGEKYSDDIIKRVYDWCGALCQHDPLRRAVDDAHMALTYPYEALVFVYRGLEWLKMSQKLEWEDLATDMGVTLKQVKELKKTANHQTGVRHATDKGSKMRAIAHNYGTWVCALLDAINSARARLDSTFHRMSPDQVSNAVMRAMPVVPYP